MGKIIELPENLANQIAAGEVVERPASVVKELLENAIDAKATQIDILVEEAGLKSIKVIDNGVGIEKEDVQNAFKRHATSKIHNREELFRIRTLGFRGEALPSIASVARVILETATTTGTEGRYLEILGGKIVEEKAHQQKVGTTITVENLFYNTPARLKYMRSLQTELGNIGDVVNRLALSHPQIAFRFVHDGNKMTQTVGNGDLKQTIAGVYGVQTAKKMLAIEKSDLDFMVKGYVSLPELTRASKNYLSIMINGRYIKNFALNKAIIAGYGSKLMVGRYPIGVIQIEMDPLLVDVNVHPTKQEVRLSKEKELMTLIQEAISEKLAEQQLIPEALSQIKFKQKNTSPQNIQQTSLNFQQGSVEKPTRNQELSATYPQEKEKLKYDKKTGIFYVEETKTPEISEKPVDIVDNSEDNYPLVENNVEKLSTETVDNLVRDFNHPDFDFHSPQVQKELQQAEKFLAQEEQQNKQQRFPELEYFGQMQGTFLFAQSPEGLTSTSRKIFSPRRTTK